MTLLDAVRAIQENAQRRVEWILSTAGIGAKTGWKTDRILSKVTCEQCGGPHCAQFQVPERVWKRLGIADDAFLCAECVHAIASQQGVNLAWFVNDENYWKDESWQA